MTKQPSRTHPILALVLCAALCACSDDQPATPANPDGTRAPVPTNGAGGASDATTLARERAAMHFQKSELSRARDALAPLVAGEAAAFEDLVRAAAVELADAKQDAAEAFLARAAKVDGDAAALHFLRGQIQREAGETEKAREELRKAHAQAPDDLATRLALAEVEHDLENPARAEELYRSVVELGIENAQTWYVVAVYRLARLYTETGREDLSEPLNRRWTELQRAKVQQPSALTVLLGSFGKVAPPVPIATRPTKIEGPLDFTVVDVAAPALRMARELVASDLDGDLARDLLAYGPYGVAAAFLVDGTWKPVVITDTDTSLVRAFDADNDGDLDLLVFERDAASLWVQAERAWKRSEVAFPKLPSGPSDVVALDYDHEGDLDLALVGTFGARIWRRDGTAEIAGAQYVDEKTSEGLPSDRELRWVLSEDFDGDNDVDLLVGSDKELTLLDSLRRGRFAANSKAFDVPHPSAMRPVCADFDGDAHPDLWIPGDPTLWLEGPPSVVAVQGKKARVVPGTAVRGNSATVLDLDGDGAWDVVWREDGEVRGTLALATPIEHALVTKSKLEAHATLCGGDLDGDGANDLACSTETGVRLFLNQGPHGNGARLSFRGLRDNRRAVGAVVEYRSGGVYRRIYSRGEPELATSGASKSLDLLRITWPNGVVQTDVDVDLAARTHDTLKASLSQSDGQVGSCPFLYSWNGTTYTFISDVIGGTPLGLPIGPDMLVPPDHDEYVLVRGEQCAPKDGAYELQLTEELREVTYLDHAKLLVVDHPSDTEIFPNELFCFPPFPVAHTHTVRAPLAPTSVVGSDGRDWSKQVASEDHAVAQPMKLLAPQFAGLAEPWFLELAFDREKVAKAKKLRLLLCGWFYWSDASANMASARNPAAPFVPPILQVPDGNGGWKDTGPPVGFPAGKTKTMVVDVTELLRRDDPRIRVFTTLRLYWDRVVLAVDDDDAPLRVTELAATSATAWQRGFSAPLGSVPPGSANPEQRPELFDWDVLAPDPRWNQHPGSYTRYGECLELVTSVDDRFVILGAGDALALRFDATSVPPLEPGQRRDFLVYLDGWAKDRDPNSHEALEVEPLPFHAMSGYPYGADEHFPDGEVHRRWRAEWNTRAAKRWIAPLSPAREAEWLLAR